MRQFGTLVLVFLAGCGFVQVSTGGAGSKTGGTAEADSSGKPSGDDEASRLKAAYDDFAAKGSCLGKIVPLCAHELRDAAGIKQRPHGDYDPVKMWNPREGQNPDPKWISGWDSLPASEGFNEADSVFQVLAQALIAKAGRQKCEADYQATYEARKKAAAALDAKIDEALKEKSDHDRIHALLALRPSGDQRYVGARFRLESEILKLFDEPSRKDLITWAPVLAPDMAEVRPLLSLETETRNACAHGEKQKYFPEEITPVDEEIAKSRSLKSPSGKLPEVRSVTESWEMKTPFVARDQAKIASITRDDKGALIRWESKRDEMIVLGCKEAKNRVIIQNNTVTHDKSCTYGQKVWTSAVDLTAADLPKVEIEKGDEIEVLFVVNEAKEKASKSGKNEKVDRKLTGRSVLVTKVTRGTNVLWKLVP